MSPPAGAGALHSISTSAGTKRVVTASSNRGFEIRDGVAVEMFQAPEGVTLTAVAASAQIAVFAGTVQSAPDRDIWIAMVPVDGPTVTTRFGGSGDDVPVRIQVDANGAIYIAANTDSADFPVTQSRWRGGRDGVLVKLNPDLTTSYATYLGGASTDDLQDLAVDASGSVFIAAASNSAEIAPGAHGAAGFTGAEGLGFTETGAGAFRATVQAWHTPNANVIFAGTAGQGIFRSSDGGQTWDPLNQGLGDLNVTSIAGDAQTLYVGTPRALYRSTNGGTSWSETALTASGSGVRALAGNPQNRSIVYVSSRTGCGLIRSSDGGRTWQAQTAASEPLCASAILATATSAYAFTNTGVYQQADSQWRRISTFAGISAIAVDEDNWYAVVAGKGVWKSTDAGVTWIEFFTGLATSVAASDGRIAIGTSDQGVLNAALTRVDDAAITQPVRSVGLSGSTILAGTGYLPDIYIAKVSPRGDQILFSTFEGGSGVESSPRIAIDPSNNVIVAAATDSFDIIATFDAAQKQSAGGTDVVLFRLSPSFDLLSQSYFGGSGADTPAGIAVDTRGFVYLAGTTASPNLAVSANADRKINDSTDAFLAVLSPGFASISYVTYIGRDGVEDRAAALAIEGSDSAWIAGASGVDEGFAVRLSGLVSYRPITAIRNAASLVAGPIAPASTISIEGSGFGSSFFGLTVRIGSSDASVLRVSDTALEVSAPADLEPGTTAPVTVNSRTGLFQGSVAVDRVAPGVFSANRDGKGVALAAVLRIDADNITTVTPVYECIDGPGTCTAVPIEAGDEADQLFLLLRGTGIRNRRTLDDVQVTIGGKPAEVQSADALDAFTGTDQIVVKMPAGLGSDAAGKITELTIAVTVEGKTANPVTMAWIY